MATLTRGASPTAPARSAALFVQYGAPLVIKEDNDKAFQADEVENLFARWGVEYFLSPPYYPRYNGAVESGIGTLKTYAHHEAARNFRPGEWTCDDVEAARLRANELSLPQGHDGPTPSESWKSRVPSTSEERKSFRHLARCRLDECLEKKRKEENQELGEDEVAAAERQAITLALVACELLMVRRRRISPPIKSKLWPRIK